MTDRFAQFTAKDRPLKDDVGELGRLVGEMLREQCGDEFFALVERARLAAISDRRRADKSSTCDADDAVRESLESVLHDIEPHSAVRLVRGFSAYFQIVNLAERIHRIRRRREYLQDTDTQQPESVAWALEQLKTKGVSAQELCDAFSQMLIEPVFTAHPTEATRRSLLEKQQQIARLLIKNMDPTLTIPEQRALTAQVRSEITASWQTEEHPSDRISVADERDNVLFYLTQILYRIVAPYYENLHRAVTESFEVPAQFTPPRLLSFNSWVGGDMDGNPNVNAETIKDSLVRHRTAIIHRYYDDVMELSWRLSQSASRVSFDERIARAVMHYRQLLGDRLKKVHRRHQTMFYRRFLRLIAGRLQATLDGHAAAYSGPQQFYDDIQLISDSLRDNRGEHAGLFLVNRLLRKIQTFGFHLATLDVRQDSHVFREAVGAGLGYAEWMTMPADQRTRLISEALADNTPPQVTEHPALTDSVAVFATMQSCRMEFGDNAIGPCVISMAQDADDVLSVMLLAKWAGMSSADGNLPLDIAPLFETVDDLHAGPEVMRRLLNSPVYAPHLAQREQRQMIMIGYSDSNKDGGLVAARWALQQGQRALANVLEEHSTKVVFFHGRGGTISRGGGKFHQGILAAPYGTVQGRLRVTEQGEIINAKYGLRGIALRTLEQSTSAVLLATLGKGRKDFPQHWYDIMDFLAARSREAYRDLVYREPNFTRYFRAATPIDVIERMRIGSRPASRRKGAGVKDLRAIPWVFSWTQSRQIITGWYGVGVGFSAAIEKYGEAVLREMLSESVFLRTLVDDVEMVLAKSDMPIARSYAALADDDVQPIFGKIEAEYHATREVVLRLKGTTELLEQDPTLRRAIYLRNPYVDPMSYIQVDLLRRWRAAGSQDDELLKALLISVNGIAHGLQNTG
ncbi:MAG: phosphoenolpyruvate carboxylase [Gammaproteobacteria bacterium]|nr:phosphoenolpyruvate carboxylase [Gammaproteobacteria bacterium]